MSEKLSEEISIETLRELLVLDASTGRLFWRERARKWFPSDRAWAAWNARYAGMETFTRVGHWGYRLGSIFNRGYRAHRVAWAIFYGEWPQEIDHINHNRADNRISNLRSVSHQENNQNRGRHRNNTSGVTGVEWNAAEGKWQARITIGGKARRLGLFVHFSDAVAARLGAEKEHGFHPNHGV